MKANKITKRAKRVKSIRKRISGLIERPRLSIYRSNKHIYIQAVDDTNSKTLAYASDVGMEGKKKPIEVAFEVGKKLGAELIKKKVTLAVFDRRGYKYHGRVKALADGVREAGVKF